MHIVIFHDLPFLHIVAGFGAQSVRLGPIRPYRANRDEILLPICRQNLGHFGAFRRLFLHLPACCESGRRTCIHAVLRHFQSSDPNGIRNLLRKALHIEDDAEIHRRRDEAWRAIIRRSRGFAPIMTIIVISAPLCETLPAMGKLLTLTLVRDSFPPWPMPFCGNLSQLGKRRRRGTRP